MTPHPGRKALWPLLAALAWLGGCTTDPVTLGEVQFSCASDLDCSQGFLCQEGTCQRPGSADAATAPDGGGSEDAGSPDGAEHHQRHDVDGGPGDAASPADGGFCDESAPAFCQRQRRACGTVTALDPCGRPRTASCGTCPSGQTCSPAGACL